jgi:hypothetical protein
VHPLALRHASGGLPETGTEPHEYREPAPEGVHTLRQRQASAADVASLAHLLNVALTDHAL